METAKLLGSRLNEGDMEGIDVHAEGKWLEESFLPE